jgi:hypothetical protein
VKRTIWIALVAAAALAAPACGKKKDEPQPATGSGSAMAGSGSAMAGSAAAGSGSAMAGSGSDTAPAAEVDVPTEVDFETEAQAKITEKNLEAELKAVEQELAQ